jgi:hypothetical protein
MRDKTTNGRGAETAAQAIEFQKKLAAVKLESIAPHNLDRCAPRKQQAVLARQLFKILGLKGVRVTTPRYSMASCVDVRIPRRNDYDLDQHGMAIAGCEAWTANTAACEKMTALLDRAFPHHTDRSDYRSDYFDSCWSVMGEDRRAA